MPSARCLDEAILNCFCSAFTNACALHSHEIHCLCLQMLHVHAEGSSHSQHFDSINGITPAMRNARERHFNNVNIPFEAVTAVEDDLLQIIQARHTLPG